MNLHAQVSEVPEIESFPTFEHLHEVGSDSSAVGGHEEREPRPALVKSEEVFGIVGRSYRMRQIYEAIRKTATSNASVLIEGESGTGKELVALAFHRHSNRSGGPFICINCAAIPRELIESELFGHKRGAFTGANCEKRGLIEAASGGTLFLDEIAEMPRRLQAKLLRVLQERKLRRIGDEREIDVDFRLVSATNRDTSEAMREGAMRVDLFYRVSTIRIKVPPLRERSEDLPLIADHFVRLFSDKYRRRITGISEDALKAISRYSWPGNVRELENVIEYAVLFCHGSQLLPEDLPENIRAARFQTPRLETYGMSLNEIVRQVIESTLERTGGNVKKTARILNLNRQTLYRKMKVYNLECRKRTYDVASEYSEPTVPRPYYGGAVDVSLTQ